MFYIKVTNLDYDDYPVGGSNNIGPFASKGDAENFMEDSVHFYKTTQWGGEFWKRSGNPQKHSVSVYPVELLLTPPDVFNERGY